MITLFGMIAHLEHRMMENEQLQTISENISAMKTIFASSDAKAFSSAVPCSQPCRFISVNQ